eukprot:8298083-Pyramimonas_sp.AAC.1
MFPYEALLVSGKGSDLEYLIVKYKDKFKLYAARTHLSSLLANCTMREKGRRLACTGSALESSVPRATFPILLASSEVRFPCTNTSTCTAASSFGKNACTSCTTPRKVHTTLY